MSPERIDQAYFSSDIREFIVLLHHHAVRYVVVGGEAVIHYGHARLTGDIDFFYDRSPENAQALYDVLLAFWSNNVPGLSAASELLEDGVIVQFGRPPNRIDLLNRIDGVGFAEAWESRVTVSLEVPDGSVPLHFLGIEDLIRNKEAAGRPKDLDDLAYLKSRH
jgi:hypothetical protein